jgi:hypothetical protein
MTLIQVEFYSGNFELSIFVKPENTEIRKKTDLKQETLSKPNTGK